VLFSLLHIYANYKAVTSVVMEIFNRIRLFTVIKSYLRTKTILSPLKANQDEAAFFRKYLLCFLIVLNFIDLCDCLCDCYLGFFDGLVFVPSLPSDIKSSVGF